ncbi:alpha/beta hydrolase family protein [Thalassotalea maritima]|uniref:alpha/beta hydrolase family protein n=1 Tax=Thalassotalea maritima TaxID=3242416 RepID=UPI0035290223
MGKFFTAMALVSMLLSAFTANHARAFDELPVESFFKYPELRSIRLSPTGEYFAATADINGQVKLVVMRVDNKKLVKVFNFSNDNDEVGSFGWLNDERIYASMVKKVGPLARPVQTGFMFAANFDGDKPAQLMPKAKRAGQAATMPYGFSLLNTLQADSEHILVTLYDAQIPTVYKVNVYSGSHKRVEKSPVKYGSFITERNGTIRAVLGSDNDDNVKLYGKAIGSDDWQLWYSFKEEEGGFRPLGLSADEKSLYLIPTDTGKRNGLFKFSLTDKSLTKIVDLTGDAELSRLHYSLDYEQPELIAVERELGQPEITVLDNTHPSAKLLRSLQAAFPGKAVSLSDVTKGNKKALVSVYSDKDPGTFYLMDLSANKLEYLMRLRSWLKEDQLASMEPVEFNARDGLKITGYLTRPKGATGKTPLILLVHGGPYGVRDDWGFDPEAQFFANRGYAVLQVNYRGSGGRGNDFQYGAYKQMGREMQDDLTDATRWAIEQGIADKDKVCIYGASYGGYAALMGVIKEPDLYQCAIGYVGLYNIERWEKSDTIRIKSGRRFIDAAWGYDDEDFVRERSPVYHVDKIKAGLLLIHGKKDQRVPIDNYYDLTEALDDVGHPYQSLLKDFEGHGFYQQKNVYEAYRKMESFLGEYLR